MELDCLEEIKTDHKVHTLTLFFGSPDGGMYEDVILTMEFDLPTSFHLPFYQQGVFETYICDKNEARKIVPKELYEDADYVMRFKIDNNLSQFYVHFSALRWKLAGGGPIKNNEELIGANEMGTPEMPPGFEVSLQKFSDTFLDSMKNAFKVSDLKKYFDENDFTKKDDEQPDTNLKSGKED